VRAVDELGGRLARLLPESQRESIVHGDYRLDNLDDILFYEAFAHFKFAVIAQGIAAPVAAGSMAGQDFGNLDQEVLEIAEEGLSRPKED
jgi:hypothetical protein